MVSKAEEWCDPMCTLKDSPGFRKIRDLRNGIGNRN